MTKLDELKARLDRENAEAVRLGKRDLLKGNPPSAEYKAAHKKARATWLEWCRVLDAK